LYHNGHPQVPGQTIVISSIPGPAHSQIGKNVYLIYPFINIVSVSDNTSYISETVLFYLILFLYLNLNN